VEESGCLEEDALICCPVVVAWTGYLGQILDLALLDQLPWHPSVLGLVILDPWTLGLGFLGHKLWDPSVLTQPLGLL